MISDTMQRYYEYIRNFQGSPHQALSNVHMHDLARQRAMDPEERRLLWQVAHLNADPLTLETTLLNNANRRRVQQARQAALAERGLGSFTNYLMTTQGSGAANQFGGFASDPGFRYRGVGRNPMQVFNTGAFMRQNRGGAELRNFQRSYHTARSDPRNWEPLFRGQNFTF